MDPYQLEIDRIKELKEFLTTQTDNKQIDILKRRIAVNEMCLAQRLKKNNLHLVPPMT